MNGSKNMNVAKNLVLITCNLKLSCLVPFIIWTISTHLTRVFKYWHDPPQMFIVRDLGLLSK